jgi:transcriptional regulator with GAF, ATPase, and Fis domain
VIMKTSILDLALATSATRISFRTASLPRPADGEPPRIMKCKDPEQMQRDNIIAALNYTRWKIYGPKGAVEILSVNPSTLAARMRSFGIRRDRN